MNDKNVAVIKWLSAVTGAVTTTVLGGNDKMLELLCWLVVSDFLLGIIVSIRKHKFSPLIACAGFVTKMLYFLTIAICVRIDLAIGTNGTVRNISVLWFVISEGSSVAENLCILKVLPKECAKIFTSFKNGFSIRLIDVIKQLVNSATSRIG